MNTKSKRMVLPDVLKGLAVVLMIHAHVLEQLVNPLMFEGIPGKIAQYVSLFPGAAVFMLVMGYFLGYSSASSRRIIKRGFILFGGGILLNIFLNISYMIRFVHNGYPDLIPTAIFGVDILLLAGLSLIIIGGLKRVTGNPIFWITMALIIAAVTPWVNQLIDSWDKAVYLTAFFGGTAKWSYFPLFPWLAYPLAGIGVYHVSFRWWNRLKTEAKWAIGITLLAITAIGFPWAFNIATDLSLHYHHGILYFLWSFIFVLLVIFILERLNMEANPISTAFLSFTGREVTLVYVIQWILIGNLAAWYGNKVFFAGHIAWTIGFVLLSVLIAWVYRKISNRI